MNTKVTLPKDAKRLVVKVGTSTLTHGTGKLNLHRIEALVRVLSDLMNSGRELVLVSSGAVGAGVGKLGLAERPSETRKKQALAAIGQSSLMSIYDKFFGEYGHATAQVLLTKDVFEDERRREIAESTFSTMFEYGVIPIVNENDVISIEEIELAFGENDSLAAHVAKLVGARLLVILSDIDGLYDRNPNDPEAKVIPVVDRITGEVESLAGGAGTTRGTGGMATKIKAAKIVTGAGINMIIANGAHPEKLYGIFEGEQVGTLFQAVRS